MFENVDVVAKKSVNQMNLQNGYTRLRVNIRNLKNKESCDIVYECPDANNLTKADILMSLLSCRAGYLHSDSPADFLGSNAYVGNGMMDGIKKYAFCEEITEHFNRLFSPEELKELEEEVTNSFVTELEELDEIDELSSWM